MQTCEEKLEVFASGKRHFWQLFDGVEALFSWED